VIRTSRISLDRHQKVALGLYLFTLIYLLARDDFERALAQGLALGVLLLPILFYRIIAYFAGFGFPEVFARDYGTDNHPGPYALLFWILYLAAWAMIFFELKIY
jgi:hypothetical protein